MDTTITRRVLAQLNEREIVDLAGNLIRIPSFCPDETPVARFLAAYFEERGYQVDLQEVEPGRFQTMGTLRGAGGGRSLMFNGHLDINSLMLGGTRDPWTPSVEGNRLYGHGVQNMKGGVAAMIAAAEAVRRAGVALRGDLMVACVAGETQGGEGTYHLVQRGVRTDGVVLPEPFGIGHLVTVHGGIVQRPTASRTKRATTWWAVRNGRSWRRTSSSARWLAVLQNAPALAAMTSACTVRVRSASARRRRRPRRRHAVLVIALVPNRRGARRARLRRGPWPPPPGRPP